MDELIIEEELCVHSRAQHAARGWAQRGLLTSEDICADHSHHCTGLTERLRVSSKDTATLNAQHAGPGRLWGSRTPLHILSHIYTSND